MENNLVKRIIDLLEKENRPLDISYISTALRVHWFTAYKAIADLILAELQEKHAEILQSMSLILLKTSKGYVLTPRRLINPTPERIVQ